jgi:hypothetical protein
VALDLEEVDEFMITADKSGDGQLDWPEFLETIHFFYPGQRSQFKAKYLTPAQQFTPELSKHDVLVCLGKSEVL